MYETKKLATALKKEPKKDIHAMTRKELFAELNEIHTELQETAETISEMVEDLGYRVGDTEKIIELLVEGMEGELYFNENVLEEHIEELETQLDAIKSKRTEETDEHICTLWKNDKFIMSVPGIIEENLTEIIEYFKGDVPLVIRNEWKNQIETSQPLKSIDSKGRVWELRMESAIEFEVNYQNSTKNPVMKVAKIQDDK